MRAERTRRFAALLGDAQPGHRSGFYLAKGPRKNAGIGAPNAQGATMRAWRPITGTRRQAGRLYLADDRTNISTSGLFAELRTVRRVGPNHRPGGSPRDPLRPLRRPVLRRGPRIVGWRSWRAGAFRRHLGGLSPSCRAAAGVPRAAIWTSSGAGRRTKRKFSRNGLVDSLPSARDPLRKDGGRRCYAWAWNLPRWDSSPCGKRCSGYGCGRFRLFPRSGGTGRPASLLRPGWPILNARRG